MAPRTRSQGLATTQAQDLEVDLLRSATSKSDEVVVRLVRKYSQCITFNPNGSLAAWRKQLLCVLEPTAVSFATPEPVPPLCSVPLSSVVPEHVPEHVLMQNMPVGGLPRCAEGVQSTPEDTDGGSRTPTQQCSIQCAECSLLRLEVERLRRTEQQASDRVKALEAEIQHLHAAQRSAETVDQHREQAAAPVAEPPALDDAAVLSPTPLGPPLQPVPAAQNLKVVVHNLTCNGAATPALLTANFTQFCRDRLMMAVVPNVRVVKVFQSRPGSAAGLLALRSQREVEALFLAKRQHLDASCSVSIEHNRTCAERRQRGEARRQARRPTRGGRHGTGATTTGDRIAAHGQTRIPSNLRAEAPTFVPTASAHPLPDCLANPAASLHQE
jgi:hypothetical protein